MAGVNRVCSKHPPTSFYVKYPTPYIIFTKACTLRPHWSYKPLPMILVTPELDIPVPFSLTTEEAKDLHQRAQAAFNTVEFLTANGMQPPAITVADKKEARAQFFETPSAGRELNSAAAVLLKSMLDEYDVEVVRNAAQVRNYVKMRLLMLTGSDKESTQLKALEMLGKMSDVGAFAERLDINITHRTTEELQAELATKLSAYMDNIIDVESSALQIKDETYLNGASAVQLIDLDEELGMTGKELEEPKADQPDQWSGEELGMTGKELEEIDED